MIYLSIVAQIFFSFSFFLSRMHQRIYIYIYTCFSRNANEFLSSTRSNSVNSLVRSDRRVERRVKWGGNRGGMEEEGEDGLQE